MSVRLLQDSLLEMTSQANAVRDSAYANRARLFKFRADYGVQVQA